MPTLGEHRQQQQSIIGANLSDEQAVQLGDSALGSLPYGEIGREHGHAVATEGLCQLDIRP